MNRVAVIGAGLCGAAAAATLVQSGYHVTVFDKGRAVGGRMSSKRTVAGYLDMGAQYFTVRSPKFQRQVQSWLKAGCVEVWNCTTALLTFDEGHSALEVSADQQLRYIGTPSMQAPVKALLSDIPLVPNCRINCLQSHQNGWSVFSETRKSYTGYSAVLLTMPPVQAQQLLVQSGLPEVLNAQQSILEPCWAIAVYTETTTHGDAIFCQHPKLRFVSHQAKKTGRYGCYILHFNTAFTLDNIGQPEEFWFKQAVDILQSAFAIDKPVEPVAAHRWLYASQNTELTPTGIVALPEQQLWIGGDWSFGGRVENAYLAGLDLADSVIRHSKQTNVIV